jgi:hypothetical protein
MNHGDAADVIDNSDQVNDAAECLARREIDARAKCPWTISRECLGSRYATRIGSIELFRT